MKKQQETNALKQEVHEAEIHQTIDSLDQQLNLYRKSVIAKKNLYWVHCEFDKISEELSDLRARIMDLAKGD